MTQAARVRLRLLAFTVAAIAAGLSLRLLPLGLPWCVTKWGGSVLWGAMVYGIVGLVLVHTPGLDAFRLTLAGKLLIGRVFSPLNLVAYAGGILAARLADRRG